MMPMLFGPKGMADGGTTRVQAYMMCALNIKGARLH